MHKPWSKSEAKRMEADFCKTLIQDLFLLWVLLLTSSIFGAFVFFSQLVLNMDITDSSVYSNSYELKHHDYWYMSWAAKINTLWKYYECSVKDWKIQIIPFSSQNYWSELKQVASYTHTHTSTQTDVAYSNIYISSYSS